jgi:hypothetical protein
VENAAIILVIMFVLPVAFVVVILGRFCVAINSAKKENSVALA